MVMSVKEAEEHIRDTVKDSSGMGVWTAGFFMYVLDDIRDEDGEAREDEDTFEEALENLVEQGVMERVGRNGFQVCEDWLNEHGIELDEDFGLSQEDEAHVRAYDAINRAAKK